MPLTSTNPTTGERIRDFAEHTPGQLASLASAAARAFQSWRRLDFDARAVPLHAAARVLRAQRERFATLMAEEMGKPLAQGRAEIEKCAAGCEFFARNAAGWLSPEAVPTEARRSYVAFAPLGVVLAVMPWNFPFWQVFRAAAPALMAGNTMWLKHASNVTGCALACEAVFQEAGLPEGVFQTLRVGSSRVAELIAHPAVRAVTLTGSTPAGQAVAAEAGRWLKQTVLELGGSDPYVVLEDADVEAAAATCVAARLINSGQSCIAAKRFIVVESARARFQDAFVAALRRHQVGDPLREETTIGPMARHDLRDELERQSRESVTRGARVLFQGEAPPGPGAFFAPVVLADVRPGMPAYDEETFGPIAAIIAVRNEAEAIRVANDTAFGLGAAVFTGDPARGERVAAELEAGSVFVNDFVRSDPRLPFGGVKQSGHGRELSRFGLREFVNVKTIWVK